MFKRNIFKILAIVFFLLTGATYFDSQINNQIQPIKSIKSIPTFNKGLINQTPTDRLNPISSDSIRLHPSITTIPPQTIINPANTPVPQPTSVPPTSAPQGLKVSLSIDGSSVGTIDLSNGANQCDVLTQALSQGKIQSLNMRYNNDMGTNAVYQINGIGKENAVWWGFKVNGQSPSQGCSYIKVNNGDNVGWTYVGN